jgi:TonB family protein
MVLEEIRSRTGINFIYNDELINRIKTTCRVDWSNVVNSIKNILSKYEIMYTNFADNNYVLYTEKKFVKKIYKPVIIEQNIPESESELSIIKPKILDKPVAIYPEMAVKNKIEGKVKLKFMINKEGNVCKHFIENTSGSTILDSAATDYAYNLKFIPAMQYGKPKSVWMFMTFEYYLEPEINLK